LILAVAYFARSCQKPERYDGMADNYKNDWPFIGGVAFIVFMAWLGLSELYRCYTTGELLARSGRGSTTRWQLITYESDPFNFVGLFAIDVVLAALGLTLCVMMCLRIREWWGNKPKPATE
jgi:hypothetical protein